MKIRTNEKFTNNQIIKLLNDNNYKAIEKNPLFGSKQVKVESKNISLLIINKNNELEFKLEIPMGVVFLSMFVSLVLFSIITTAVIGEVSIVKGGFIPIFIGIMIGNRIYKSNKSVEFANICNDITNIFK